MTVAKVIVVSFIVVSLGLVTKDENIRYLIAPKIVFIACHWTLNVVRFYQVTCAGQLLTVKG